MVRKERGRARVVTPKVPENERPAGTGGFLGGLFDVPVATVVIVVMAWLHGVLVGVAHGDESLFGFICMTVVIVVVAMLVWRNDTGKRMMAAVLFFTTVCFTMCFVTSITWFRNPKMPALPDIIHETIPPMAAVPLPFLPQFTANAIPDAIIAVVTVATLSFTLLNKYRWFILRRFFVIYGCLMALRTVCIVVTSLPDPHPHCRDATPGYTQFRDMELREVVVRTLWLFGPIGEKLTCGDLVFSGHTMILVLYGMVWHTYFAPVRGTYAINWVKTSLWCLIAVALFFIVANRLHYTLDVLLAVFLAATTWGSYHRIAWDVAHEQEFCSVYIVDAAIVYPAIRWLEGPTNPGAGIQSLGHRRIVARPFRRGRVMTAPDVSSLRVASPTPPLLSPPATPASAPPS